VNPLRTIFFCFPCWSATVLWLGCSPPRVDPTLAEPLSLVRAVEDGRARVQGDGSAALVASLTLAVDRVERPGRETGVLLREWQSVGPSDLYELPRPWRRMLSSGAVAGLLAPLPLPLDPALAGTACAEGRITLDGPAGPIRCADWTEQPPLVIPAFTLTSSGTHVVLLVPPERKARGIPSPLLHFSPDRSRIDALRDAPVNPRNAFSGFVSRGPLGRGALLLPLPSSLFVPGLVVPAGGHLRFSFALDRLGTAVTAGMARFQISYSRPGSSRFRELASQPVLAGPDWAPFDLDLSFLSGRAIDLRIAVLADPSVAPDPLAVLALGEAEVVFTLQSPPQAAAAPPAPSVLLVVVDCLRPDALGFYGQTRATSPFLDGFAASGLRYQAAFSSDSWTVPGVASLLSGLPAVRHGADLTGLRALPPGLPLLAETLSKAGFRTFGAVATPMEIGSARGFARGFDAFWESQSATADQVVSPFVPWVSGLDPREGFFAWLHLFDPHQPYAAPEPDRRRFLEPGDSFIDDAGTFEWMLKARTTGLDPSNVVTADALRRLRAQYDGEVRYVDRNLEALFAALKASGRLDSTLVLVTADHGESFGEHGLLGHGSHVWQEQTRVPLLVVGPGVPAGTVAEPVSSASITPSILRYLGLSQSPAGWVVEGAAETLDFRSGGRPARAADEPAFARAVASTTRAFHFPADDWKGAVLALRSSDVSCIVDQDANFVRMIEEDGGGIESSLTIPSSDARARDCLFAASEWWRQKPLPGVRYQGLDPLRLEELRSLGYVGP
jgi:arylsulfatase A-like enzyme